MQVEIIDGIRVLHPEPGLKITNVDRTLYSDEVWLGKQDSPGNYTEVEATDETAAPTETA